MELYFNDQGIYERGHLLPLEFTFDDLSDGAISAGAVAGMLSNVPVRAVYKALWRPMDGEFSGRPFPVDPRTAKLIIGAEYPSDFFRNDLVVSIRPVDCALRGVTMLKLDDLITMDAMNDDSGIPFLRANLRERERERQKGYASSVPPIPAEIRFYS
ncbi:TPA: hypothetical protein HA251_05060 [Candidatus Woesearchaeota archaeon]|nr:hypothetical protein [Candidatus Woesearchaeota archaeon]